MVHVRHQSDYCIRIIYSYESVPVLLCPTNCTLIHSLDTCTCNTLAFLVLWTIQEEIVLLHDMVAAVAQPNQNKRDRVHHISDDFTVRETYHNDDCVPEDPTQTRCKRCHHTAIQGGSVEFLRGNFGHEWQWWSFETHRWQTHHDNTDAVLHYAKVPIIIGSQRYIGWVISKYGPDVSEKMIESLVVYKTEHANEHHHQGFLHNEPFSNANTRIGHEEVSWKYQGSEESKKTTCLESGKIKVAVCDYHARCE